MLDEPLRFHKEELKLSGIVEYDNSYLSPFNKTNISKLINTKKGFFSA